MLVTWDEPKRLSNIAKHGLDFAELDPAFFVDATIYPAKLGRLQALGRFEGHEISVIFTWLGSEGISLVSMRMASPKERLLIK